MSCKRVAKYIVATPSILLHNHLSVISLDYVHIAVTFSLSQFEFEFRRFNVNRQELTEYDKFSSIIKESHRLPTDMQFTVSYTDPRTRDHLPITNNDNMLKAFLTAMPFLRIIIYRERGEFKGFFQCMQAGHCIQWL